jgi:phosphomannomutase
MLDFLIDNFSNNLKIKYYEMIKMGIITSKYSNGAFISYCENNLKNYKMSLTKTGISNIQKESKNFDISICYEYNGQGTIYISQDLSTKFGKLSSLIETSKDSQIIELFQLFIALFNSITSDGVSNLLVIESIMKLMNLSIKDVYDFYNEISYKIVDIKMKYNKKFITNEDDTKILEPKNLQKVIDEISNKYKNTKIYVRPIGTEDYLRVYVESNDDNCEKIIEELSKCLEEEKI